MDAFVYLCHLSLYVCTLYIYIYIHIIYVLRCIQISGIQTC